MYFIILLFLWLFFRIVHVKFSLYAVRAEALTQAGVVIDAIVDVACSPWPFVRSRLSWQLHLWSERKLVEWPLAFLMGLNVVHKDDYEIATGSAHLLPAFLCLISKSLVARLLHGGGCGANRRLNFPPQQEVQSFFTLSTESTGTNVIIIHSTVFFVYFLGVVFSFNM